MRSSAAASNPHLPLRVLIAGGGVAGLETLLALSDLAGRRVAVTLLAPEPEFVVRAMTVGEPFDRAQGRHLVLADVAREHEAELVVGRLAAVDPVARVVTTGTGAHVPFDVLVVAAGAVATEPLPGALTFRGRSDVGDMRDLLDGLLTGQVRSVVFTLARTLTWSLPLYELALMTSGYLIGREIADRLLTVVTPAPEPLDMFGPVGSEAMRGLLAERNVELRTSARPSRVTADGLVLADGSLVPADRVVTVPELRGPSVPGLPADPRGFLPVDRHGRVRGMQDIYAAGDVTAYPVKQGGLAAQQADAVAEAIAARAGALVDPQPFHPVIRGLLLTGAEPIYLRAEPGVPARPREAAVAPVKFDAQSESSRPLWWPPAKVAGRYLAPYLGTARPSFVGPATLVDRPAPRSPARPAEDREALQLALTLADADAGWSDYASALRALDAAATLAGALPPEYERKRDEWRAALGDRSEPARYVPAVERA
jgi:sulfide:quinone oxidoreductase